MCAGVGWGGVGSQTGSPASSDPAHRTFILSGLDAGMGRRGGHPAFLDSLRPLLSHLIPGLNFVHEQGQQSAVALTPPLYTKVQCRWWQEMGGAIGVQTTDPFIKGKKVKKSKKKKKEEKNKNKKTHDERMCK